MDANEIPTNTQRIWREFGDDLRRFILRRVDNPEDAEDLLQETFIKIHGKLDTLQDNKRLSAWIYQIARNTITDHYRRQRAVESLPEGGIEDLWVEQEEFDNDMEQVVGGWLRPMVDELPNRYRQALWLTEFEGLTQKEMAEQLDLSIPGRNHACNAAGLCSNSNLSTAAISSLTGAGVSLTTRHAVSCRTPKFRESLVDV